MKRVLIVGSDEDQSQKLSEAIEAGGPFSVSRAATVREACLLIAQQLFDLALIPGKDVAAARQALHALQPELDLAVIMPGEPVDVPELEAEDLRGYIFVAAPEEGLRNILGDAFEAHVSPETDAHLEAKHEPTPSADDTQLSAATGTDEETLVSAPAAAPESGAAMADRLRRALQEVVANERIEGGVVMSSGDITMSAGALTDEQVNAIAQRVKLTWRGATTALLQFIRPPDRTSDLLLFTRPIDGRQLLTLAAKPDFDVGELRRLADGLAREPVKGTQRRPEGDEAPASVGRQRSVNAPEQHSFALLLRPRRPMPAVMRAAVSTALYDVAEEARLNLHFQQVDAELVHLVTTCPKEQGSGWLARLYKEGVEERIQDQFGIPAHMWRRGFYATESELPLSEAELRIFAGDELE